MAALCLPNDSQSLLTVSNPETHLIECLTKIVTGFPLKDTWDSEEQECGGFYRGPTALSYLFLHLSKSYPTLLIESKSPREWAADYITGARPAPSVDVDHCGILIEEVAFCAVAAAVTQDIKYVHRLLDLIPSKGLLSPSGSNEWV
jgi:hypothetical protein